MRLLFAVPIVLAAGAVAGDAWSMPVAKRSVVDGTGLVQPVGNTSSNSSSNTSSDSGSRGSSYVHTHRWSVETDGSYRGGTTRIQRYTPNRRDYRERRGRSHRWDD